LTNIRSKYAVGVDLITSGLRQTGAKWNAGIINTWTQHGQPHSNWRHSLRHT